MSALDGECVQNILASGSERHAAVEKAGPGRIVEALQRQMTVDVYKHFLFQAEQNIGTALGRVLGAYGQLLGRLAQNTLEGKL